MHPKLRAISVRVFEQTLKKDGFVLVHQKGSHKSYVKDNKLVTLPFHHLGDTFPPKTLKNMIKQAGWTEEYLARLTSKKLYQSLVESFPKRKNSLQTLQGFG